MDDSQAALSLLQANVCATEAAADRLRQEKAELQLANDQLSRELRELQSRLDLVEEIIGPTEAQRKIYQKQLTAAREAALRVAHEFENSITTRCVGRLDENWLRSKDLTEAECSMLQRGCVSGEDGVPHDISLLGDPWFSPYDRETLQPNWEAKGGFLRMSLSDIRERWGEEVALEVMQCSIELDTHDPSRRLGVELPWHEKENREMEPSEIIDLFGQQLSRTSPGRGRLAEDAEADEDIEWEGLARSEVASPEEHADGDGTWLTLEAMMSDLGLHQISSLTAPLMPAPAERDRQQFAGSEEADEDVVAYALEEDHQAQLQHEAMADEDIQQLLHEPQTVLPVFFPASQPSTQHKRSSSRRLTPSGAQTPQTGGSPVAGTRSMRAPSHQGPASSSPNSIAVARLVEGEQELATAHEVPSRETLLLELLQDEVSNSLNFYMPLGSDSPSSSSERSMR